MSTGSASATSTNGIRLVEARFASVLLYRRIEADPAAEPYESTRDIIDLPEISARLALADIYDAIAFEPARAIP
ncbi:hypothetical protein MKK69_05315 [Methylobacterium sp. J-026]|uniref:hypothetical protein n=1 Tax=Methylobacterium sp. J-026 TaxID=2836624 RepID=UPI001FB913EF|nr:hypothetical protein [Methylobacterium sp. J-026]MCJ2133489.1 hypothetical protein [Methylobacterium sp. J-026]